MAKIYLVRHGQDEDNAQGILNGRRDKPLTELGREQARITAEKLVGRNINTIYSTPLQRGYETAMIIHKRLGLAVDRHRVHPQLIERDFGIMTGKKIRDIQKLCDKILVTEKITYFLEAERAEDFPTVLKRAETVLNYVQSEHQNENVLLVCHGDIGSMIRAAFYGWNWEKALLSAHFDNCSIFELPDPAIVK